MKTINEDLLGTKFISLRDGYIFACEPITAQWNKFYHVYYYLGDDQSHFNPREILAVNVKKFYTPKEYPEMYI